MTLVKIGSCVSMACRLVNVGLCFGALYSSAACRSFGFFLQLHYLRVLCSSVL